MTTSITPEQFQMRLAIVARQVDDAMAQALAAAPLADEVARPARLLDAMRHAGLAGGKRLRPFLVIESAALFNAGEAGALIAGVALECVHCYSLAHDDLPAMDNADLRRGRPSAHKAFDEATAILAGDALLTLAFDLITRDNIHADPTVRVNLTRLLARTAGIGGMAGGQMLDLAGEGRFGNHEAPDVARIQQMKTGALIRFACCAGAILGQAPPSAYDALDTYGRAIGEAFQIADDLLDVEGDAASLGKQTGQDAALGKTTFVSLLGVSGARARLNDLLMQADTTLSGFGAKADMLRAAAHFIAARKT